MTRLRELSRGAGLAEDRGGCPAVARRRVAPGRKEVAMQMLRPMGWRGGGEMRPYPGALWLPKQTIPPEQSPGNAAVIAASA